jgi:hypothetical protein
MEGHGHVRRAADELAVEPARGELGAGVALLVTGVQDIADPRDLDDDFAGAAAGDRRAAQPEGDAGGDVGRSLDGGDRLAVDPGAHGPQVVLLGGHPDIDEIDRRCARIVGKEDAIHQAHRAVPLQVGVDRLFGDLKRI